MATGQPWKSIRKSPAGELCFVGLHVPGSMSHDDPVVTWTLGRIHCVNCVMAARTKLSIAQRSSFGPHFLARTETQSDKQLLHMLSMKRFQSISVSAFLCPGDEICSDV